MAYLLLPVNRIGHGHLTRALIFAEWLREAGRQPMIALQGSSRYGASTSIPTTNVPTLYDLPYSQSQRIVNDLARIAMLSDPAVIIEDTHPQTALWPRAVRRVVVVRPTSLDHMRVLNRVHGKTAAALMICDHPTSPTWPYDDTETAEILSWPNWVCLGPVFRTATPDGLARVRERYRLGPEDAVFVFSMGAGGEIENSGDRPAFLGQASAIARQLRERLPAARSILVRGPLFPSDAAVPEIFEDVSEEPDLPSLLALARGAVVRPGYNVTWECIAAATPFVAIQGTAYQEPTAARLAALADRGIETSADIDRFIDPGARALFAAACARVLGRFDGSPREAFLTLTAVLPASPGPASPGPVTPEAARPELAASSPESSVSADHLARLTAAIRDGAAPIPLRIRVDDVTRLDPEVRWLIAACRELGAALSLEVVPYHNTIAGADLDAIDPGGDIIVGQHGYAHLPDYRKGGIEVRGEFINDPAEGKAREQLGLGAARLRATFGDRFRGGYSAPYDVPPRWLADAWQAVGGRYLSWILYRPQGTSLPCVRLAVDPWDWQAGKALDAAPLVDRMLATLPRGIGLVFHPQCLKDRATQQNTIALLRCLVDSGCVPTPIDPARSAQ